MKKNKTFFFSDFPLLKEGVAGLILVPNHLEIFCCTLYHNLVEEEGFSDQIPSTHRLRPEKAGNFDELSGRITKNS